MHWLTLISNQVLACINIAPLVCERAAQGACAYMVLTTSLGALLVARMQGRRTAAAAMRHCLYLAPIGLLGCLAEITTWPFAIEAAVMSAGLGIYALRFASAPSQQSARTLFKMSLLYLPLLLLAMGVHRLPNNHSVSWEDLVAKVHRLLPSGGALGTMGKAMDGVRDAVSDVVQRLDGDSLLYLVKCPSKVQCKEIDNRSGASQKTWRTRASTDVAEEVSC